MLSIGGGTTGIVIGSRGFAPGHAFNVTVFEDKVMFLDFLKMIINTRSNKSLTNVV